ncbi:MAG: endolytic transglycosylase MltG [bacterium]|nr:endolytic transglycosylase MltG [bacterium]
MGRKAGVVASLLGTGVIVLATAFLWFQAALDRHGPLEAPATLIIPEGTSAAEIAEDLHAGNIIASTTLFRLHTLVRGDAHLLKAGEYAFGSGETLGSVIARLVSGDTVVHALTLPEGLSSAAALAIIEAHPALEGTVAAMPREGSLLPETYHFERGTTRQELVGRMMLAMEAAVAELWAGRAGDLPLASPAEAVILASIVEKETGRADERRHVAGVLVNRLRRGMRLQSDPTVIYALTKGLEPLGRNLLRSDWQLDDPYNTYRHKGLPPGPIANPGRETIAAVLDPLDTPDLYFVADGSGGHAFAATLEEHNRNVVRWRRHRSGN